MISFLLLFLFYQTCFGLLNNCCTNTPVCSNSNDVCQFQLGTGLYACVNANGLISGACTFENLAMDPGCDVGSFCISTPLSKNCDHTCVSQCLLLQNETSCTSNLCKWQTSDTVDCDNQQTVEVSGCTPDCGDQGRVCGKNIETGEYAPFEGCLPLGWLPVSGEHCHCKDDDDHCSLGLSLSVGVSCLLDIELELCVKDLLCLDLFPCGARRIGTDEYFLFPTGCLPDGFEKVERTDPDFCKVDCSCPPENCEGTKVTAVSTECISLLPDREEEFCLPDNCLEKTTEKTCVRDTFLLGLLPIYWEFPSGVCIPDRFDVVDNCHCDCSCTECRHDSVRRTGEGCSRNLVTSLLDTLSFDYCVKEEDLLGIDLTKKLCMFNPLLDIAERKYFTFLGTGPIGWEVARDCFCNCPSNCTDDVIANPCRDGFKLLEASTCSGSLLNIGLDKAFCIPEGESCLNVDICAKLDVDANVLGLIDVDLDLDLRVKFKGCLPVGFIQVDIGECDCVNPGCSNFGLNLFSCKNQFIKDCRWCHRFPGDFGICQDNCQGEEKPNCALRLSEEECNGCVHEDGSSWEWCEVGDRSFCARECPSEVKDLTCFDNIIPRVDCIINNGLGIDVACVGINNDIGVDAFLKLLVTDGNNIIDDSLVADVRAGVSASFPRCLLRVPLDLERHNKTCIRTCNYEVCIDKDTPKCSRDVKFILRVKADVTLELLDRIRNYLSTRFNYPRALISVRIAADIQKGIKFKRDDDGVEVEVLILENGQGMAIPKAEEILYAIEQDMDGIEKATGASVEGETVETGTEVTGKSVEGTSGGNRVLASAITFLSIALVGLLF